jgi:hypothetical protein
MGTSLPETAFAEQPDDATISQRLDSNAMRTPQLGYSWQQGGQANLRPPTLD